MSFDFATSGVCACAHGLAIAATSATVMRASMREAFMKARRGPFRAARSVLLADDVVVARLVLQEAAIGHPVDLFLELADLVILHAEKLRHQACLALLGLQVAQQFLARAVLVLAQPFDGAIERATNFLRRSRIAGARRDDAAAPFQIADLARAFLGRAPDERLH